MARVSASAANPFDGPLFSHRGGFEAGHQLFVEFDHETGSHQ